MTQHFIASRIAPADVKDTRTRACGGRAMLENFLKVNSAAFLRILGGAADV